MVNRGAVILRHKEPAVRWINEADPKPPGPASTTRACRPKALYRPNGSAYPLRDVKER
jgi:hypothetical protein